MDPRQLDALAQRLAQNPQDTEALNAAYQHGQADPRGYAVFLEKVAAASTDPLYAAHWFSEAANVWTASLGDAHRAARSLMSAVERDPTNEGAAERLSQLYREKGDTKGIVGLLERRVKAITQLAASRPELRSEVARISAELGRVWLEELRQNDKALGAFRVAVENNREDIYSIYQLRELLKAAGKWAEAIPYYEAEQRLIRGDTERQLSLYQDEAEACRSAGDLAAAARALRVARGIDSSDPGLKQQLAANILERIQGKKTVAPNERAEAAQLFVELAETYPGEHGYSYSACALECEPAHDRAVQLVMYYGEQLGQELGVAPLAAAYLRAKPDGVVAAEARALVTRAVEAGDDSLLDALAPSADAPPAERVRALLDMAKGFSRKAKKREAAEKYSEVLAIEPSNEEAVEFLEAHLRQARKYADLRDLLLRAAKDEQADLGKRLAWLDEVAALCEGQLKDVDGSIEARRQRVMLDTSDEVAADQLVAVLEKAAKWDDLAELLARRAETTSDLEQQLKHERAAATVHSDKRKDAVAAAEAWARICVLTPDDETAVQTAVKLFEQGARPDRAAQVIERALGGLDDDGARATLGAKLGALRATAGDLRGAGEAYAEAATTAESAEYWEAAERCFAEGEAWEQAATAAGERAHLAPDPKQKARWYAKEAEHLGRLGDDSGERARLEQATELDPESEDWAIRLEGLYTKASLHEDLVTFWLQRAEQLGDLVLRRSLRMRAALLQRDTLSDLDGMRGTLTELLSDGPDVAALRILSDDAEERKDFAAASEYLDSLTKAADAAERADLFMRHARVLADGLQDFDAAIGRYQRVLLIDDKHREALTRLAALQERTGDAKASAASLRKLLDITGGAEKLAAAQQLATLCEGPLDDLNGALEALEIVHALDAEDFDAVARLSELSERLGKWESFAKYLRLLIDVEGDDDEISRMTLRIAAVIGGELKKWDEALDVLAKVAAGGDGPCRDEYVRLGDELERKSEVADKLVEWFTEEPTGPERSRALRGAFDRYEETGKRAKALDVGLELVRTKGADPALAERMEKLAVEEKNLNALGAAHDVIVRDVSGPPRAEEMVRQAEVLRQLGVSVEEALERGEQALTSVAPADVEPLLERLALVAKDDLPVIGLYERQVTRCKAPGDRLRALARAAEVASDRKQVAKSRQFFDIALSGGAQEDQISSVVEIARRSDQRNGGTALRRIVAEALAGGGQGARDGGKTRSVMLGHAAALAQSDLADSELAFTWIREALVAHVDDERLDQLDQYATKLGTPERAADVIGLALQEVFDGPLVRQLLLRRASIRQNVLSDKRGAAEDLKKLHDLSPADVAVSDRLSALYTELGDFRGIVQLYEDQILRGKDPTLRAELARKVALLWENELAEPREAADAWRRVLRMKANDEEAKEGLARAKGSMLVKAAREAAIAPSEPPAAETPAAKGPQAAEGKTASKPSKKSKDAKSVAQVESEELGAKEAAVEKPVTEAGAKADGTEQAPTEDAAAKEAEAETSAKKDAVEAPAKEVAQAAAKLDAADAAVKSDAAETSSKKDAVETPAKDAVDATAKKEAAETPAQTASEVADKPATKAESSPKAAPAPRSAKAAPPPAPPPASVPQAAAPPSSPVAASEPSSAPITEPSPGKAADAAPESLAVDSDDIDELLSASSGELVDEDELIAGVDEYELIDGEGDGGISVDLGEDESDPAASAETPAIPEAASDETASAAATDGPSKRSLPPPPPARTSVPPPLPSAAGASPSGPPPMPSRPSAPPLPSGASLPPPPPVRKSSPPPTVAGLGKSLPPPPLPASRSVAPPASGAASKLPPPPGGKVPPPPPPSSVVRPVPAAEGQGAAGPSRLPPPPPNSASARRAPPPPPPGAAKKG